MSDTYIMIPSYNTDDLSRVGVKRITNKAVLIEIADGAFEWFPLSQIRIVRGVSAMTIVMPFWMARQKGFSKGRYIQAVDIDGAIRNGRAHELFLINEDGSTNTDAVIML
jgi:hypothetical protein